MKPRAIVVQLPSSLGFPILRLLEHDSGVTTPVSYSTFLKHRFDSVYMLAYRSYTMARLADVHVPDQIWSTF